MSKLPRLTQFFAKLALPWEKLFPRKKIENKKPSETKSALRAYVPLPPTGFDRIKWLGPGFLWMLSAVGSGSVLFTPRVGARYGYLFLWLALLVCFFMWVMIREAGRYTVVTGETLLEGFHKLPGPKNWAIWLIFLPQCIAAVAGIADLSALVGSAFMVALPGNQIFYTSSTLFITSFLVITGGYKRVEQICQILAIILLVVTLLSAFKVFPTPSVLLNGLSVHPPTAIDLYFLLPWVGTILAGSMGIIWYSYWAAARGYGGPTASLEEENEQWRNPQAMALDQSSQAELSTQERLYRWLRILSDTAATGVIGGGIIIIAFLILGAELLGPQELVPQGIGVARDLTHLLSEIWGQIGFWLLILAIVIALGSSILANQDGWGRSFADMTLILLRGSNTPDSITLEFAWRWKKKPTELHKKVVKPLSLHKMLKNGYILTLTTLFPLIIFLIFRDPVKIMSVAGIVASAHTPFIVLLIMSVNYLLLPKAFKPSIFFMLSLLAAGLFYTLFTLLSLLSFFGLKLG